MTTPTWYSNPIEEHLHLVYATFHWSKRHRRFVVAICIHPGLRLHSRSIDFDCNSARSSTGTVNCTQGKQVSILIRKAVTQLPDNIGVARYRASFQPLITQSAALIVYQKVQGTESFTMVNVLCILNSVQSNTHIDFNTVRFYKLCMESKHRSLG